MDICVGAVEEDVIVFLLLHKITPKSNHCWFYFYANSAKLAAMDGCARLMDPESSNAISKFLKITTLLPASRTKQMGWTRKQRDKGKQREKEIRGNEREVSDKNK